MKKIMFSLLLSGLTIGVAPSSKAADAQRYAEAIADEIVCVSAHIGTVDDGVSDALTVALALAQVCGSEYRHTTDVLAWAYLDNEHSRRTFRDTRNDRRKMVEYFLPDVMLHRTSKDHPK